MREFKTPLRFIIDIDGKSYFGSFCNEYIDFKTSEIAISETIELIGDSQIINFQDLFKDYFINFKMTIINQCGAASEDSYLIKNAWIKEKTIRQYYKRRKILEKKIEYVLKAKSIEKI